MYIVDERACGRCCCFVHSPNFFILDEPTNHLDMETIEALGRALQKFQVNFMHTRPLSVLVWSVDC